MRISDWSSDVCSSDLRGVEQRVVGIDEHADFRDMARHLSGERRRLIGRDVARARREENEADMACPARARGGERFRRRQRSAERRGGHECVSTCKSLGSPCPYKKNTNKKQTRRN